MSIIISQDGKNAQRKDKLEFENEGHMQKYIHENPEVIPVYEINEDKRLFVAVREFSTEAGPIDALAFDQDGDIYIIETKLQKNYTRRDVVAQALDYGASLWRHNNPADFIAQLDAVARQNFQLSFEEKFKDFFNLDDEQAYPAIEAVKSNLQSGNIKFVIMMDVIEDRLKDLIVYINQTSQFDIYAVQMEYYKHERYEIMIPKLFGVEVKKNASYSSGSRIWKDWTPEGFLLDAKGKLAIGQFEALEKIFDFSKRFSDDIVLGKGQGKATINPIFSKISDRKIYGLSSDGRLGFHIDWSLSMAKNDEAKNRLRLLADKMSALGLSVSEGTVRGKNEIGQWADKVDEIISILSEMIK